MGKGLTKMARISTKKAEAPQHKAHISNELVEAFVRKNNLVATKILFYLAKANISLPSDKIITISLSVEHLCDYCKIDQKTLRRNIKQLTETSISIKDEKRESFITVIPKASFVIGTNKLELDLYKEILELIWQVERQFTVIDVKALMTLTSKHSVRMLQFLEMMKGYDDHVGKRKHFTLEELNLHFGTKYKRLNQFVLEILEPTKEELDSAHRLSYTYQIRYKKNPSGRGRPVADSVVIDLVSNIPQGSLF